MRIVAIRQVHTEIEVVFIEVHHAEVFCFILVYGPGLVADGWIGHLNKLSNFHHQLNQDHNLNRD